MARPTRADINIEILDTTAGLLARHGFDRTSLQQVADALGYSKAGLLHHYPSKKALFDAVLAEYTSRTKARIERLETLPHGIERDRAMIEDAVDFAYDHPGMSALGQQLNREGLTEDPRFVELGLMIVAAIGIDFAAPDMVRMVRAFSALAGATFTARMAVTANHTREWREHIVATAMDALGHGREEAASDKGRQAP